MKISVKRVEEEDNNNMNNTWTISNMDYERNTLINLIHFNKQLTNEEIRILRRIVDESYPRVEETTLDQGCIQSQEYKNSSIFSTITKFHQKPYNSPNDPYSQPIVLGGLTGPLKSIKRDS